MGEGKWRTKKIELVELGKDPWMINIYDQSFKIYIYIINTLVISCNNQMGKQEKENIGITEKY